MYDIKAMYQAHSPKEAVELLTEHPEAKVIAGGSDVLIQMREGRLAGIELVSIYGIDELRGITMEEDGTIRIGSLSSFSKVQFDPIIREHMMVLSDACREVGSPQIRNIGTIGGNTCNGITSADSAATLLAYDAIVEILGPDGIRTTPLEDFYITAGKVKLEHNEIQTAILIKKESYENHKGCYFKYAMRNALDIATSTCSVNVALEDDNKTIKECRVAFGVAGPVPMRARSAEKFMTGKVYDKGLLQEFADTALGDLKPRDSWRASKDFRVHMMKEMAKRCLTKAYSDCGGEIND